MQAEITATSVLGDRRKGRKIGCPMPPEEARRRRIELAAWKRKNIPHVRERETHKSRIIGPRVHSSLKEAVMNVYTNGEQTCRHCGQGDLDVLVLDHIDDNGAEHRINEIGHRLSSGARTYHWVVKNDYPPIFQVLCASCNLKKEVVRRRSNRKANQIETA